MGWGEKVKNKIFFRIVSDKIVDHRIKLILGFQPYPVVRAKRREGEHQMLKVFAAPFTPKAKQLFDTYQVEYIFVGDIERKEYPNLNPYSLKHLGEVVFESGQTFIVKRQPPSPTIKPTP